MLCSICLKHFQSGDEILIIKHQDDENLSVSRQRGHYFHNGCIEQWRKIKKICPLDRELIRSAHKVPAHIICGLDLADYDNFYELFHNIKFNNQTLEVLSHPNHRDCLGRTLIYCACQTGNLLVLRKLIKIGADPTIGNERGFTPLMLAASINNIEIAKFLLKLPKIQKNINNVDHRGWTALEYAVSKRHITIVKLLLHTDQIPTATASYLIGIYQHKIKKRLFGVTIVNELFDYVKLNK